MSSSNARYASIYRQRNRGKTQAIKIEVVGFTFFLGGRGEESFYS